MKFEPGSLTWWLSAAACLVVALILLSGCSTLNRYGIGGEPLLMCKYRDGTAHLDDKIAGSDDVRASINRRFTDGDALCKK